MVSNVFFANQSAQAYEIYWIIYVCVGATEEDGRGHA